LRIVFRVIAKHSDKLDVEADLGRPVDILVSEIVSNNLLGQDVLPAHERAVRDLLKPGGRVIPARGAIRVALAEDLRDDRECLGKIDGFDLSPFNTFMPPVQRIRVDHERLTCAAMRPIFLHSISARANSARRRARLWRASRPAGA
jgi:type II protein arginine methyltransferase